MGVNWITESQVSAEVGGRSPVAESRLKGMTWAPIDPSDQIRFALGKTHLGGPQDLEYVGSCDGAICGAGRGPAQDVWENEGA